MAGIHNGGRGLGERCAGPGLPPESPQNLKRFYQYWNFKIIKIKKGACYLLTDSRNIDNAISNSLLKGIPVRFEYKRTLSALLPFTPVPTNTLLCISPFVLHGIH